MQQVAMEGYRVNRESIQNILRCANNLSNDPIREPTKCPPDSINSFFKGKELVDEYKKILI